MTKQTDGSFDPRTWLHPAGEHKPSSPTSPAEDSAAPAAPARSAGATAESSEPPAPEPGFNPRTWVIAGHGPAPVGSPPGEAPLAPNLAAATPSGPPRRLVAGGILAAALVVVAGTMWTLSSGTDDAGPVLPPPSARLPDPAAQMPAAQGDLRILQVAGMAGLVEALLDLGVAGDEALTLARETSAALGETSEEIRLEVLLERTRSSNGDAMIAALGARLASGQGVRIVRASSGSGFERENIFVEAKSVIRRASGEMGLETFYIAAVAAGVPDSLITGFAKVFSFDFDFQRDVDVGDRFEAVWEEQVAADGRAAAPPQLIYAAMTTKKGRREYYAFTPPDEVTERFFDAQGQGNERGLMRTPVDGARVSSRFGYRTHPITQTVKQHGGVDFAAPIGTPIYASGDAVVTFRQMAGGAGNMIRLDHGKELMTVYMHLSRFADTLQVGQNVRQGEIIGYVGNTGASTGPHLHYEIHVAGVKQDPLEFETLQVEPLRGDALRMYRQRKQEIDALRKQ